MADNITFISTNKVDNSTSMASNDPTYATNFPVSNLKNPNPHLVYKTADGIWNCNLGTGVTTAGVVALINHNASPNATWRIRVATSQANLTSSPVYDSGAGIPMDQGVNDATYKNWPSKNSIHKLPSSYAAQWLRIDVDNSGNIFTCGRMIVQGGVVWPINMAYGWSMGWVDETLHDKTSGGTLLISRKGRRRVLNFTMDFQSEATMYNYGYLFDLDHGKYKPLLVMAEPNSLYYLSKSIYGVMQSMGEITNTQYGLYRKNYKIVEYI